MLTILGSLLGFASSAVPEFIKIFTASQDRKHELEIMDRQIQAQAAGHTQRLEEIEADADIREIEALHAHDRPVGVAWVDALNRTVRPMLTYFFFFVFATVKGTALYSMVAIDALLFREAMPLVWDGETQALFAAVISFWFGQRAMRHARRGT